MLLSGHSILIVEDTEEIRELLGEILELHGATVHLANGGNEAILTYRQIGPQISIVLMDIRMPEMDGFQTLSGLIDIGCNAPILALTAQAAPAEIERIKNAKFFCYVPKPIELDKLIEILASLSKKPNTLSH